MARSPLNPNLDQLNEGLRLYTNHLSGQDFFTSPARYLAVERRGEEVSTQSMSAYGAKIFARAMAAYRREWGIKKLSGQEGDRRRMEEEECMRTSSPPV